MSFTQVSKNLTKAVPALLSLLLTVSLLGCGAEEELPFIDRTQAPTTPLATELPALIEGTDYEETEEVTEVVCLTMENGGKIVYRLYPDIAPITVKNYQDLVSEHFYDGMIFHRVINNFMIQTGDPTGTSSGGSGKTIKGEFGVNGVSNPLSHKRGVVSMARAKSYDSASSQFFIVHADYPSLDGNYAAFGEVISGMDVVDAIATTPTNASDRPLTEQKIAAIRFVKLINE